eukprot:TRINITY_DN4015_c0_g2_i1.p1 TRINITY_DN4015_c0_g2~~TRINITY_DN4015_c0_g2_i1.p1  ORF type:complete len:146 (-),score=20.89 TRINITY_DN4015_c0_g2_i1:16-453(-)
MLPKALSAPTSSLSIDALRALTLLIVQFLDEEDRDRYFYNDLKQLVMQHNELLARMSYTDVPAKLLRAGECDPPLLTDVRIKLAEKDDEWTTATFRYMYKQHVFQLIIASPTFTTFHVDLQGRTIMEQLVFLKLAQPHLHRLYLD